jgi:hypothetical protein
METSRCLGIAVFYSWKSFNPKVLFSDMLQVWGVQKLVAVDKIGDYIFKVEFMTEDEKERVIKGGPWRHKGYAVIVVHYDDWLIHLRSKYKRLGCGFIYMTCHQL